MPRILAALMRHGEFHQVKGVPAAHQPHPLTERGLAECEGAAEGLLRAVGELGVELDATIQCSFMQRAWQTASAVAKHCGARLGREFAVEEVPDMAERCVGAAANLTVEQIEDLIRADARYDELPPGWKSTPHVRLPFQGAESLLDAGQRVGTHVDRSCRDSLGDGQLRLFVGHGASIRFAAVHFGVLTPEEATALTMATGGFVVFAAEGDRWEKVAGEFKVRTRGAAVTD